MRQLRVHECTEAGRTLAYTHFGPPDSDLVVVWCHGLFSVADAKKPSQVCRDRHVHRRRLARVGLDVAHVGATFPETFLSDLRAFLAHPYPAYDFATSTLRIHLSGGSFGTCPRRSPSGRRTTRSRTEACSVRG